MNKFLILHHRVIFFAYEIFTKHYLVSSLKYNWENGKKYLLSLITVITKQTKQTFRYCKSANISDHVGKLVRHSSMACWLSFEALMFRFTPSNLECVSKMSNFPFQIKKQEKRCYLSVSYFLHFHDVILLTLSNASIVLQECHWCCQ